MRPLLTLLAVVLAPLVVPNVAMAQTNSICEKIAETVRALEKPSDNPGFWHWPLMTLQKSAPHVVQIDIDRGDEWMDSREDWLKTTQERYRPTPELLSSIEKQSPHHPLPTIRRFGQSNLFVSERTDGTLACSSFIFFSVVGGAARLLSPPSTLTNPHLCRGEMGIAATVGGTPAFVIQKDNGGNKVELKVAPWRDGSWQPTCRASVAFKNSFEVRLRFCQGGNCAEITKQALSLVENFDDSPVEIPYGMTFGGDAHRFLPAPGGAIPDEIRATAFSQNSIYLPFQVGEETLLARIGRAAGATYELSDYLFAAYRLEPGRLEPVAGLYISKIREKPVSVLVD